MTTHKHPTELSLHLLRLVSPSQPVGGFSYSRGLEWVVHTGTVRNEQTASAWILGLLEHSYATLDGALFWRMMHALQAGSRQLFLDANAWLAASRESRELELEDLRMSESLLHLLAELGVGCARDYCDRRLTYPAAFAVAANHWNIPPADALRGLMWTVVEGQVAAAIRLVPLGHTAGQRILIDSTSTIERAFRRAATLTDDEIGNLAPAMAMASAWHESQYSRLFRS
ncbi:urease accessory protein UreF [Bradyrhizobium sp. 41S5]|uniref:urease accessory protein UreF n=1 Tax=Bradyrhizobium sp. 41S5 TaxID=1404443 RepID=UPI00156B1469|nr:urease accessory UreF family protein [Bradyrhizobium sp. 41S5]UFX48292.1 urease accessory protein UreF [Bradyrhizobium sp. 41S5]